MTAGEAAPFTPVEAWVARTIKFTWLFYAVGGLYLVGPMMAWGLGGLALLALYLGRAMPPGIRAQSDVPPVIWAWLGGMAAMLVVLWIGHIDWNLGLAATIKSSVGWAKGWALMALFPLAGAILPIRRAPLVRAHCVLGAVTLALLPLMVVAPYIGLPSQLFVSPLKVVGGPGPEYFTVYLYTLDPASWTPRWQFYLPWSPFAGLMGVIMVLFAREEKSLSWKAAGIAAGIAMILLSKSRMSLVALPVCLAVPSLLPLIFRSWVWALGTVAAGSLAVIGAPLFQTVQDAITSFKQARADSTRVRETLQRIAGERWWNEAIWFGHGTVERGPHLVEYMMIGSHHTWYGLLFVKGVFGLLALAIPMIWQIGLAIMDAAKGQRGRLPLGLLLVFVMLTFGENIEIEAYMLWPALLVLGIHAREMHQR